MKKDENMLYGSKNAPKSLLSFALRFNLSLYFDLHFDSIQKNTNWSVWTLFCEQISIFLEKLDFFSRKMKFFQLQALVQQKWKKMRICYMAQKTRLSLYFHLHFDSIQKNKNWRVWTLFYKKKSKNSHLSYLWNVNCLFRRTTRTRKRRSLPLDEEFKIETTISCFLLFFFHSVVANVLHTFTLLLTLKILSL